MQFTLFVCSAIVSCFTIYITQRIFLSRGITDKIKNRSSHIAIATRSGGLAIFSTLFTISFLNYIFGITVFDYALIVPVGLLVCVGLYDDIYNVDFKLKFIFQVVAAKIIIDSGLIIDNFHGLFNIYEINRPLAHLLSIFIIVSIINAINFIDGIDGLAISIFILFLIFFEFSSISLTSLHKLTLIILASLTPMFYFNFRKKNKVFLGDAGSLMIGCLTSIYVLFILSGDYLIKESLDLNKIIFVFSILSYPIIDFIRIILKRIIENKSPFRPDKNHLHHILLKLFNHHYMVVIILTLITLMNFLLLQIIF